MDLNEIAARLIKAVDGIPTETNMEGVISVFNGIRQGCNNDWEDYLMKNTTDLLFYSKHRCDKCNSPIEVKRYADSYVVNKA